MDKNKKNETPEPAGSTVKKKTDGNQDRDHSNSKSDLPKKSTALEHEGESLNKEQRENEKEIDDKEHQHEYVNPQAKEKLRDKSEVVKQSDIGDTSTPNNIDQNEQTSYKGGNQ